MLNSKVFPSAQHDESENQNDEIVDDACILYCERFMEFLIDLLSQLPTRRYIIFIFISILTDLYPLLSTAGLLFHPIKESFW